METITSVRLKEILQEPVKNPVPLTHVEMAANGFTVFMPAPEFMIWTNDLDITIIQEDEVSAVHAPFLFKLGEGNSAENVELKYEHQLKRLMKCYESRPAAEAGQMSLV